MKKSIKYVSVSTIILALIVVTISGMSADAAGGVKTTYGRRLQEQSPESLDSSYAGWSWVDTGNDDYFGNVGEQAFVIAKGGKYRTLTVNVEPKVIKPTVKVGSSASMIPSEWAGNSNKAKISSYQHTVTVTANTGGTVTGGGTYIQGDEYTIKATANSGYKFSKWSDGNTNASRILTMSNSNVSYIATFETNGTMTVTSSLPTKSGDVSIMTLDQAHIALGGQISSSSQTTIEDPSHGYNTSTYYVYGICDATGSTGSATGSTSDNLQAVGLQWYKQLNKPTTENDYWTNVGNSSHNLFGGPLYYIRRYRDGTYRFYGHYSASYGEYWNSDAYWHYDVSGSVYIAVVRAK